MKKIYNNLSIDNLTKTEWFNQFDEKQQKQIKKGLEDNLNVSIYAKPEFDSFQMRQIKDGLKRNLDIPVYANSKINAYQMKEIRENLENEQNT